MVWWAIVQSAQLRRPCCNPLPIHLTATSCIDLGITHYVGQKQQQRVWVGWMTPVGSAQAPMLQSTCPSCLLLLQLDWCKESKQLRRWAVQTGCAPKSVAHAVSDCAQMCIFVLCSVCTSS